MDCVTLHLLHHSKRGPITTESSQCEQRTKIIIYKNIRYIEHDNIHPRNHLNQSKLHFNFHGNTLFLNKICKCLECLQIFDCCIEKEDNVNVKTNNSNEKTIMLLVIARILKVLGINFLIAMLVAKMRLKILIVKLRNSVLTMALQIRQVLIKQWMKTRIRYIRKVRNLNQEKLVTPVKIFRPC